MSEFLPVRVSPELSSRELQKIIQQQEEILGPLVSIGNDYTSTLLTFDGDQDPPEKQTLLQLGGGDEVIGAIPVTRGLCFVDGKLQEITAYRPS
jgi:hypothetical protein